jgi:hypothetical protein
MAITYEAKLDCVVQNATSIRGVSVDWAKRVIEWGDVLIPLEHVLSLKKEDKKVIVGNTCPQCNRSFLTPQGLAGHELHAHSDTR